MPAAAAKASNTSALPASEPVCASANGARGFGAADLHRDDGLAVGARAARGVEEVRGVGDAPRCSRG